MPDDKVTVTVGDILKGMEAMEEWLRRLRGALATMDPKQEMRVDAPTSKPPHVSGELC